MKKLLFLSLFLSITAIIIGVMNYTDFGYNSFLSREEKPSTSFSELDPLQFEQFTAQISGDKIENGLSASVITKDTMLWDRIDGGLASLGGNNNTHGSIYGYAADGNKIFSLDNTGIVSEGGNTIIKNKNGEIILDNIGINGPINFKNNSVVKVYAPYTTASTSLIDLPDAFIKTAYFERQTIILITIFAMGRNNDFVTSVNNYTQIEIWDGNAAMITALFPITGSYNGTAIQYSLVSSSVYLGLSPGYHTLKAKIKSVNGGTSDILLFGLGYLTLGS